MPTVSKTTSKPSPLVLGESLAEPLAVLGEWAYRHIADVHAAIEQYDRRSESEDFWQPK